MYQFAERVGWKMQKRDEELVMEFCNEVGVDKGVLKVWMHNNKNTFAKRDAQCEADLKVEHETSPKIEEIQSQHFEGNGVHASTNGSSSSS